MFTEHTNPTYSIRGDKCPNTQNISHTTDVLEVRTKAYTPHYFVPRQKHGRCRLAKTMQPSLCLYLIGTSKWEAYQTMEPFALNVVLERKRSKMWFCLQNRILTQGIGHRSKPINRERTLNQRPMKCRNLIPTTAHWSNSKSLIGIKNIKRYWYYLFLNAWDIP